MKGNEKNHAHKSDTRFLKIADNLSLAVKILVSKNSVAGVDDDDKRVHREYKHAEVTTEWHSGRAVATIEGLKPFGHKAVFSVFIGHEREPTIGLVDEHCETPVFSYGGKNEMFMFYNLSLQNRGSAPIYAILVDKKYGGHYEVSIKQVEFSIVGYNVCSSVTNILNTTMTLGAPTAMANHLKKLLGKTAEEFVIDENLFVKLGTAVNFLGQVADGKAEIPKWERPRFVDVKPVVKPSDDNGHTATKTVAAEPAKAAVEVEAKPAAVPAPAPIKPAV